MVVHDQEKLVRMNVISITSVLIQWSDGTTLVTPGADERTVQEHSTPSCREQDSSADLLGIFLCPSDWSRNCSLA